jgi:glycosyltransferase involved in cell wall biosynthesis
MISLVFPVHNEAPWLDGVLEAVLKDMEGRGACEVVLAENGSSDGTAAKAAEWARRRPGAVRAVSLSDADYDRAARAGVAAARGRVVALFDLDHWRPGFLAEALRRLDAGADVVAGRKSARLDRRPAWRRALTRLHGAVVGALFPELKGFDANGPLVFKADAGFPGGGGDTLFKLDFLRRAVRAGLRVEPADVDVAEMRPARSAPWRRLPRYAGGLLRTRF